MIGSIGSSSSVNLFPPRLAELNRNLPTTNSPASTLAAFPTTTSRGVPLTTEVPGLAAITPTAPATQASFGDALNQAISGVNSTMQNAEIQKARVMSGETNNLHQAMLSVQEANVAFSLMTEVRNKLVESYQEVMRMQV